MLNYDLTIYFFKILFIQIFLSKYVQKSEVLKGNADLKLPLYASVHIKLMPWKFPMRNPKNSRVIYP